MRTWALNEYALYVGRPLLELLQSMQLASDATQARALVESGQVWLDGLPLHDPEMVLKIRDVKPGSLLHAAGEIVQLLIWADEE